MAQRPRGPGQGSTTSNLFDSPLGPKLSVLAQLLEPAIARRESDSVLLFGLPTAGKGMLSRALATSIRQSTRVFRTVVIKADVSKPNVKKFARPRSAIDALWNQVNDPEAGQDLSLINSVLIIRGLESISEEQPGWFESRWGPQMVSLIGGDALFTVTLGITSDPLSMDPVFKSKFTKVLHVPPQDRSQIPDWIGWVGIPGEFVEPLTVEILELAEQLGKEFVGPGALNRELKAVKKTLASNPEVNISDFIPRIVKNGFIDSSEKEQYEYDHDSLIKGSDLLEEMLNPDGQRQTA